ncbi:MAG: carbohydrate ABC transporter permease [Lachnospiraceae bacterium]|nr:carbohydrate ABC transporter permease [Lachnospiraceae bacterium]
MNSSKKKTIHWGTIVTRIMMIIWSLFILFPFYIMFVTAFKSNEEFWHKMFALPETPIKMGIENFAFAWTEAQMGSGMANTVIICGGALVFTLILSSMVAYELTRRHIPFKGALNTLYLTMLLVPTIVCLTPTFFVGKILGLYNKRVALILFYTAHEIPFIVYTMRSFFSTIPHELEEAAYIDGASSFQTFCRVMLPVMRPGFVTAGIFALLDFWDEYIFAMQLIVKKQLLPAAVTILRFQMGDAVRQIWGPTFAACVTLTMPILVIYLIFQKKLMGGMTAGSVKG